MMVFFTGPYTSCCQNGSLPTMYEHYVSHSQHSDRFMEHDGTPCFVSVARGRGQPFLVVAQTYSPAGFGWNPGILLIPETDVLFIGAGERLLAYHLRTTQRLWVDTADTGFYRWDRYGSIVVMSAELELAAWDITGEKRWAKFVEPPWSYEIEDGFVRLDVMGVNYTVNPCKK